MVCLEVSLATWEPDPFLFSLLFRSEVPPVLYRKKLPHKWVRPPRPKRDLEKQTTYGPRTWQRGLYAQWSVHPLKFGHDPCPARRGLVVAVKCCERKKKKSFSKQRTEMTHHYRRHCSRVSARRREIRICFLFSDPTIVGLRQRVSSTDFSV